MPNLLLQKLPAPTFTATVRLALRDAAPGERGGLVVMGLDHASLAVRRTAAGWELVPARAIGAHEGAAEREEAPVPVGGAPVTLRVTVRGAAMGGAEDPVMAQFAYSVDGRTFTDVGAPFRAREGRWIGAKVGLFALRPAGTAAGGHADVDWFRVR